VHSAAGRTVAALGSTAQARAVAAVQVPSVHHRGLTLRRSLPGLARHGIVQKGKADRGGTISVRVGYRISVRQRLSMALHFVAIGLSLSSSRTPSIRAPFRGDEHVVDGIVSRAKREGNGTRGRGCGAYNRVRVGRSGAFSAGMRERQQIGLQSETGSASKPAWDVSTHEEGKEGSATLRDAALNVGWPSQGLPVSTPAHFAAPNGHTPDSLASLEISE